MQVIPDENLSQNTIKDESFIDKIKSIHWFVKTMVYIGLFSLILFQDFRQLATSMLVLSLYSVYSLVRPAVKGRRVFYLTISVMSFVGIFVLIAIGQLLD